ncbi:MAG: YraN family protein [Bacillota bacterium]|nr:YraN family protein [Bacillota bacterium]
MENIKNKDNRTIKRKIGDIGEDLACKYLSHYGYKIVDRNFSSKTGEIDIIAIHPVTKIISFIEVKSRNTISYGLPCQAVNYRKQQRIKTTAEYYRLCHPNLRTFQPSFDIVEILRLNDQTYIRHLRNAF